MLVPAEEILILPVELPLPSQRQRREALPFAVEEHIAEPLDETHLALGPAIGPKRYLAAAVRHSVMQDWVATLDAAGLGEARLIPDALALPAPEDGEWSVAVEGGRTLARTADGPAFAIETAAFAGLWQASGRPPLTAYGAPTPEGTPQTEPHPFVIEQGAREAGFDLRQGAYAVKRGSPALFRRIAAILVAGIVANALVFALDTATLHRQARAAEADAAALFREVAPARRSSSDPASDLIALLPAAADGGAGFIPLLSRASQALQPYESGLIVQSLSFEGQDALLNLDVEAPNLQTLQQMEAALNQAGLTAESGAATTERGGAQARISVRGGAGQ